MDRYGPWGQATSRQDGRRAGDREQTGVQEAAAAVEEDFDDEPDDVELFDDFDDDVPEPFDDAVEDAPLDEESDDSLDPLAPARLSVR